MSWYDRFYEGIIENTLQPEKVLVLYGPRRVGKTSMIKRFLSSYQGRVFLGVGEDMPLRELFASQSIAQLKSAFSGYDIVFIDEAQKIPDIGTGLKILVDHIPGIKVIASGSSSFQLSSQIGEPLTGRNKNIFLFPISALEIKNQFGGMHIIESLEKYLIYGMYPEVLTAENIEEKREYLVTLRDSYLFRDILELENIRNSDKLYDLLRLLAFQIGYEVSLQELGNQLGMSKNTVEKYLNLLEKSFVIKKVHGFSRNLRKEITKTSRYYFLDNGIRNSVINNFNPLNLRDDAGMLWENFLFVERVKKNTYLRSHATNYFWRTYDGKEIDLVEEKDGHLHGFEFKWGSKKTKPPTLWTNTYADSTYEVISKENFLDFVT
ncbi:MAG: ATP-binding protein [Spirochaetales bacterium]|nr:ATP-binding protein [Spirochaetales bacterium]